MKTAIITDSSAALSDDIKNADHLKVLSIPIMFGTDTFVEGVNLTIEEFFEKMAASDQLPTTSQPSLADLTAAIDALIEAGYTQIIGLFLSSGISGFSQNIQYLVGDYSTIRLAFPDTKITSAPLGVMVRQALAWGEAEVDFEEILTRLSIMIDKTQAYIMVDDLNHLVKGGRLTNGAAIIGNLLKIKPILHFSKQGTIDVYEKIRSEKKAVKRLTEILSTIKETDATIDYTYAIIHANAPEKAADLIALLMKNGITNVDIYTFGSVIATHLGEGAVACAVIPIVD